MKSTSCLMRFLCLAVASMLLSGCLLKTATVPPRQFVLASIAPNEPAPAATEDLSVVIGFVKMPSYLLAKPMAVRQGASEIQYFENAFWAERLDHCFEMALAANLSRLLSTDRVYLTDWPHDQV